MIVTWPYMTIRLIVTWLSYNLSLGDRADTVLGAGGPEASHAGGHCEGDEGQKESQTQPAHRGGGAEPTNKFMIVYLGGGQVMETVESTLGSNFAVVILYFVQWRVTYHTITRQGD